MALVEDGRLLGEHFEAALLRLFGGQHITRPSPDVPLWEIHRQRRWLFSWGGIDYHVNKRRLLAALLPQPNAVLFAPSEHPSDDEVDPAWRRQNDYLWRLPNDIDVADIDSLLQPGGWLLYGADRPELDESSRERYWDAVENRRYDQATPLFDALGLMFYLDGFAKDDPWTVAIRSADDAALAALVPLPQS